MAKSVIVLGKGGLAIQVADWFDRSDEYELKAVVPVIPEPQWTGSLLEWARERRIPVVESGDYRDLLEGADRPVADLGVSVFYDKIFKADGIARFGKLINLHNAPLPKYRGVSPINWALKNGETAHGVTIHEITPGVDEGPIISQAIYSIFPEIDEVEDVYKRAIRFAWALFEETMPILDRITPVEQDHSLASHYRISDNNGLGERASWRRDLPAVTKRL